MLPQGVVFLCTLCAFRCGTRLELVKHYFATHAVEPKFRLVCGIKGCSHTFYFGSTFSSFKTHASRKHTNWKENLTESTLALEPSTSISEVQPTPEVDATEVVSPPTSNLQDFESEALHRTPCRSAKETAALFLITFKEQYKLPQKAIDFAVGSINSIVGSVCSDFQQSMQGAVTIPDTSSSPEYEDPFSSLQTEYMQSKFYRETFGLVVKMFVI